MKRTIALPLFLLASACVDNRSSIQVEGRAAPSDTTSCKFAPGGQNILGPGTLDVAAFGSAQPSYGLVVYVTNNLANPTTAMPPVIGQIPTVTASAKAWTANAAKVRVNPSGYTDPYGPNPALLEFTGENVVPLDGQTAQPAGGQMTQYVEAISGPLGEKLAPLVAAGDSRRIVLGITLEGQTGDGAYLDTGEWYFDVVVCNGCLVAQTPTTCPTGEVLTRTNCFSGGQDSAPACATAQ